MSFRVALLLAILVPASLSLGLAYVLVRKRKPGWALAAGLSVIAAAQIYLQASLQWGARRCIERACAAGGLSPSCQAVEFGCTEWVGPGALVFLAAGAVGATAFLIGAGIMILRERRRRPPTGQRETPA